MFKTCSIALLALTLSACGGGGGSSGSSQSGTGTGGGTTAAAVTFTPAKLTATFVAGTAQQLTVTANATTPGDFNGVSTVYAFIVDDSGIIQANPQITAVSTTQYKATMTTSTSLTAGTKTGNLSLRLCKDAACAVQFPGSPVPLPYELTVTPKS